MPGPTYRPSNHNQSYRPRESCDRDQNDRARDQTSTPSGRGVDHYSPHIVAIEDKKRPRSKTHSPPSSSSDSPKGHYVPTSFRSSARRNFNTRNEENFVNGNKEKPNWAQIFKNNDKWITHQLKEKKEKKRRKEEERIQNRRQEEERIRQEQRKKDEEETARKEQQRLDREKKEEERENKKIMLEEERYRRLENILRSNANPTAISTSSPVINLNESSNSNIDRTSATDLLSIQAQLSHLQSLLRDSATTKQPTLPQVFPPYSLPSNLHHSASNLPTLTPSLPLPVNFFPHRQIASIEPPKHRTHHSPEHTSEDNWTPPPDVISALDDNEAINAEIDRLKLLTKDEPRKWRSTLNRLALGKSFRPMQPKETKESFLHRLAKSILFD